MVSPSLRQKRMAPDAALFALAGLAILAALGGGRPWILTNRTPSEPLGLYMASTARPAVGRIIAFRTPSAAFPYASAHLAYLRHTPLLKALAAGPGDAVCTLSGRLVINGHDRAAIAQRDSAGRPLPRWTGCRRLRPQEWFVFSDRVPNSFDSRYYGPIPQASLLGVYDLLFPSMEAR